MRQRPCRQGPALTIYVAAQQSKARQTTGEQHMKTRNALAALGGLLEVFGSAVAVSQAVDANRQPSAHHLRALGIDPIAFRKIVRR
jgi:hypothetical protein